MLHKEIDNMIADAMKRRVPELGVYKLIKCELTKAQKAGIQLDGLQEAKILMRMVAQRQDAIQQYLAGNRKDLADIEAAELDVLKPLMPEQCSDEDVAEYTAAAFSMFKLSCPAGYNVSMRDMKSILALVQEKYPTASGKVVSKKVQELIKTTGK